ncbi:MAG: ISKra4 family transposase, partial [Hormoscilla sp. GM102CHS1]|nr:ISKra4 family transposase [Hormoscilla sp. GM102CHS1]
MTPEKEQALQEHLDAIGKIIYEETEPNQLQDLETIEKTVRDKIQSHVSPTIGSFFIKKATGTDKRRKRKLKSCLGKFTITEK